MITFLVLRENVLDHRLLGVLARYLRMLLGRRLVSVVADSRFTTKAAIQSLLEVRIPFILGFAPTAPAPRILKGMSRQACLALRGGRVITLGPCNPDRRLKLIASSAQKSGDRPGSWRYFTDLTYLRPDAQTRLYRRRW